MMLHVLASLSAAGGAVAGVSGRVELAVFLGFLCIVFLLSPALIRQAPERRRTAILREAIHQAAHREPEVFLAEATAQIARHIGAPSVALFHRDSTVGVLKSWGTAAPAWRALADELLILTDRPRLEQSAATVRARDAAAVMRLPVVAWFAPPAGRPVDAVLCLERETPLGDDDWAVIELFLPLLDLRLKTLRLSASLSDARGRITAVTDLTARRRNYPGAARSGTWN
jgi:hypothetical protein